MNESDLIRKLHSTERTFVERKRVSDTQDIAKTVVAFANTLRSDQEGVIFLGASDNGLIENHSSDLDKLQKTFVDKTKSIYPECPYFEAHEVREDGKACLAVIVPGGSNKPYFAAPPYFRRASTSVKASYEEFQCLLATRSDKAYELLQWIGKPITLKNLVREAGIAYHINPQTVEATIDACNQFYVTISLGNRKHSFPLSKIDLTFDHQQNRLQIEREANERI